MTFGVAPFFRFRFDSHTTELPQVNTGKKYDLFYLFATVSHFREIAHSHAQMPNLLKLKSFSANFQNLVKGTEKNRFTDNISFSKYC